MSKAQSRVPSVFGTGDWNVTRSPTFQPYLSIVTRPTSTPVRWFSSASIASCEAPNSS